MNNFTTFYFAGRPVRACINKEPLYSLADVHKCFNLPFAGEYSNEIDPNELRYLVTVPYTVGFNKRYLIMLTGPQVLALAIGHNTPAAMELKDWVTRVYSWEIK